MSSDLESRVAALEAMSLDNSSDEKVIGNNTDDNEYQEPEHHSWRCVLGKDNVGDFFRLVDADDSGTRSGSVVGPDGTLTDITAENFYFTPGTQASAYLKVTISVSAMTVSAEVTDADVSADADPFNTDTAIFVWLLCDVFDDCTITQYETSDISLEGLALFYDDHTLPKNIAETDSAVGTSIHPSREDHEHVLDISGWTIPDPSDPATSAAAGTSALPARADHQHKKQDIPDPYVPSGYTGDVVVHAGTPVVSGGTLSFPTLKLSFVSGTLQTVVADADETLSLETC